jgi:methyl-accepting chemotaxis protein
MRVSFFENLSIGSKIAMGFGLVVFLFALVVWQYHETLFSALDRNDHLQSVHGAKKYHSLNIHRYMLESRRSEKDFLARKQLEYVDRVNKYVDLVLAEAAEIERIAEAEEGKIFALRVQELMRTYHGAFQEIVRAWQKNGLDPDSGLQGQFRKTIHEVEEKAKNFRASSLYLTLLQIRRAEKDLGLRLDVEYVDRVRNLANLFREQLQQSSLEAQAITRLEAAIDSYLRHFEAYAKHAIEGKENGGKGPFRDVAHEIEGYLQRHYVPDLELHILSLRRWEKDYLLRNDEEYVERLQSVAKVSQGNIASSLIPEEDKQMLMGLIERYETDFLALVDENNRIIPLMARMRDAVHEIEPLVVANVQDAIGLMEKETEVIRATSRNRAFLALAISLFALLTAIFFAVVITRRITVPLFTLMKMAEIHTEDDQISEDLRHKDEVRALAAAMGRMDGTLTRTLDRLDEEVESLDQSTQELVRIFGEMTSESEKEAFGDAVNKHSRDVVASVSELYSVLSRAKGRSFMRYGSTNSS